MKTSLIKKAIFPVGGLGTRFLPATKAMPKEMLPIVDKPLIQYAVEEALAAGIEELIFVTGRGKSAIEDHFDISYELENTLLELGKNALLQEAEAPRLKVGQVFYTRQQKALGLGHALWCARHFIHNEPFAVLLADDFILAQKPCLQQMIEAYETLKAPLAAVMEVPPGHVNRYGILDVHGDHVQGDAGSWVQVKGMVEKPSLDQAPSQLAIIGRYILHPSVFQILHQQIQEKAQAQEEAQEYGKGHGHGKAKEEIQLTDALASSLSQEPFYGYRFKGRRFDCGQKAGMVMASLNVALNRPELRSEVWEELQTLKNNGAPYHQ